MLLEKKLTKSVLSSLFRQLKLMLWVYLHSVAYLDCLVFPGGFRPDIYTRGHSMNVVYDLRESGVQKLEDFSIYGFKNTWKC